jgi:hypothetical protein
MSQCIVQNFSTVHSHNHSSATKYNTVQSKHFHSNTYSTLYEKPSGNALNSDFANGGTEPKDVGVEIFRPPCRLVRATVVHIGILHSFF